LVLNIHLQAVHRCQHTDYAENSKADPDQRKECPELVGPDFLKGQPERIDQNGNSFPHATNLVVHIYFTLQKMLKGGLEKKGQVRFH